MNIEVDVAEWLDTSSSLTVGTDLFIHDLPGETNEGVCVVLDRHTQSFDSITRANIQTLLFYYDYIVGRDLMQTIIDLIDDFRGTDDGAWAVSGPIFGESLGKDARNRNVFLIEFEVAYKED